MEYSSGFTSEGWFQQDIEYVLKLMQQGLNRKEIAEKALDENAFLLRSEAAIRNRFQMVYRRASNLSPVLVEYFLKGSKYDQKALVLYSFLKTFRYTYENFYEFIVYSYQHKNGTFRASDLSFYMEEKEQQSEKIAKWHITSKKKINNVLLIMYRESGIIELVGDEYKVSPLHVSQKLKQFAGEQDSLLQAMITLEVGGKA